MQPNDAALVSGEGVRLELSTAGVGSRVVAAAIDAALELIALFVLVLATALVAGDSDDAAIGALVIAELLLVVAGYPVLMEWLTRGRTLGKLAMGLRVVRDDGGPILFRHALGRGLAGLVLEKPGVLFPFTTIAGALTVSLSGQEKRIGDMLAGTVVLDERSGARELPAPSAWVDPPLQPWAMSLDLHRLDDRLALRLRQFVVRAHGMSPGAQWSLGEGLRDEVLSAVAPPPPAGAPTPLVLGAVLAERRRRAVWAAAPPGPYPQTVGGGPWTPAPDARSYAPDSPMQAGADPSYRAPNDDPGSFTPPS